MSQRIETFLQDLGQTAAIEAAPRVVLMEQTAWLRTCAADEVTLLLRRLGAEPAPIRPPADAVLAAALIHLAARQRSFSAASAPPLDEELVRMLVAVYHRLPADSAARVPLLQWLAWCRTPAALAEFAGLIGHDAPSTAASVAAAFGPLFQLAPAAGRTDGSFAPHPARDGSTASATAPPPDTDGQGVCCNLAVISARCGSTALVAALPPYDPAPLFPRLFDGLANLGAAPAILDLANFVTRQGLLPQHPGAGRLPELTELLSGLIGRLGRLETAPPAEFSAKEISDQVNEGVALAVSLCDALALIGDPAAAGKLYQASELSHRRLRTEAAAALAKLGEPAGRDMLVALAAEPVARLRVLSYAEELGFLDQVAPEYQTATARAEANLALWLAQPQHMNFPPTACELLDARVQYWPGYDEPIECFLFRFTYQIGDGQFSNVGIVGPLTHAFGADLSAWPLADLYAAFAGWQAEHEEIYELEAGALSDANQVEVARLQRRLRDTGFDAVQPLTLGFFFGERALVARAVRDDQPGIAVVGPGEHLWLPRAAGRRAPGPEEAYCVYKGRRLLRAFNE